MTDTAIMIVTNMIQYYYYSLLFQKYDGTKYRKATWLLLF